MGKLTCGCLNVKIFTKSPSDLKAVNVSTLTDARDEFFARELAEVVLDLEGIRVEHPCLLKTRKLTEWVVHKCTNCQMQTHAIKTLQGNNKILVSLSLKHEPSIIERLEKSPDFSPLYKIILQSQNDNHPVRTLGLQSSKYESLQDTLTKIQQSLNSFLINQESVMEERIRKYEENQRSQYAELQSKARRDKNAMIGLVLTSEEEDLSRSITEAMSDHFDGAIHQAVEANEGDLTTSSETEADGGLPKLSVRKSVHQRHSLHTDHPKDAKSKSSRYIVPQSEQEPVDDVLFDMEGLHDDNAPFYSDSDDEEAEDTDDSSDVFSSRQIKNPANYSTSVPISVPMFGRPIPKKSFSEALDEDQEPAPDPEDMAASIKALARSVHGDGTEMFGELPRPRINTKDVGKM